MKCCHGQFLRPDVCLWFGGPEIFARSKSFTLLSCTIAWPRPSRLAQPHPAPPSPASPHPAFPCPNPAPPCHNPARPSPAPPRGSRFAPRIRLWDPRSLEVSLQQLLCSRRRRVCVSRDTCLSTNTARREASPASRSSFVVEPSTQRDTHKARCFRVKGLL